MNYLSQEEPRSIWHQFVSGSMFSIESTLIFISAYQPNSGQWFIGSVDRIRTGLIPANYVQVLRNKSSTNLTLQSPALLTATTVTVHR